MAQAATAATSSSGAAAWRTDGEAADEDGRERDGGSFSPTQTGLQQRAQLRLRATVDTRRVDERVRHATPGRVGGVGEAARDAALDDLDRGEAHDHRQDHDRYRLQPPATCAQHAASRGTEYTESVELLKDRGKLFSVAPLIWLTPQL